MSTSQIELPSLLLRASVKTANEQRRTVELVFSTGAAVARLDSTGQRYLEVLSLQPRHVRLERLNAGAPLLDAHQATRIENVIGSVEPGSARVDGSRGFATVRFSKRPEVQPIWQDVREGILSAVSVGYRIYRMEEAAGRRRGTPHTNGSRLGTVRTVAGSDTRRRRSVDACASECLRVESVRGRAVDDATRRRRANRAARASEGRTVEGGRPLPPPPGGIGSSPDTRSAG